MERFQLLEVNVLKKSQEADETEALLVVADSLNIVSSQLKRLAGLLRELGNGASASQEYHLGRRWKGELIFQPTAAVFV